jgi:hypothetical protein
MNGIYDRISACLRDKMVELKYKILIVILTCISTLQCSCMHNVSITLMGSSSVFKLRSQLTEDLYDDP